MFRGVIKCRAAKQENSKNQVAVPAALSNHARARRFYAGSELTLFVAYPAHTHLQRASRMNRGGCAEVKLHRETGPPHF